MAKKKLPEKYLPWIEARKRFHIPMPHIQMARELVLNPKKFGGLANTRQEPWKLQAALQSQPSGEGENPPQ